MAATDLLSLADAKAVLGIGPGSQGKDDKVAAYISTVSNRLDRACGPIVQRPVTEYLSGGDLSEYLSGGPANRGRAGWVRMRNSPIASFTSVVEYSFGASSGPLTLETAIVAGGYRAERFYSTDPPNLFSGRLWRRSGGFTGSWWAPGTENVIISAVAGRYATQAEVRPTRFGQAAAIFLKHLFASEDQNVHVVGGFDAVTPTFPLTMPYVVKELLANDWLESVAVA